jgi:LPXTG-site transpeptidase (sortase) family protein
VKAIVRQVGVTKTNQIDTPDNIYDTGWFNQSAKPGMAGLTLINGHLGTWSDKGVFSNLTKLKKGDKFTIQKGDNKTISYVVVKTQMYDANNVDMKALLSPVNPAKPGANLITCSGSINDGTYQYNKRFVVFAEIQ